MTRRLRNWILLLCVPFGPVLAHRLIDALCERPMPPQAAPELMACHSRGAGAAAGPHEHDPLSVSADALRSAAAHWSSERTGIPYWRTWRTEHFRILTDGTPTQVRWLGWTLEWALGRVAAALELDAPPLIQVMAFRRRAQLETFLLTAGALGAESVYDPHRRQIVLALEPADRAARLAPIVHELVHAVMHAGCGRTGPAWAAEGTAELLTARLLEPLKITLQPDWNRILRESNPIPADVLMSLSVRDFTATDALLHYAQAVSWTRFLIQDERLTIRELFDWAPRPERLRELEERWRRRRGADGPAPVMAEAAQRAAPR
jgi:hypothetical protein